MKDDPEDRKVRSIARRSVGALVAILALVFVFAPTLVHDPGPAPDLFEATERRARWGLGIFVGMLLIVHPWRRPWSVVVAWILFCFSGGYLIARVIGMAIEGLGSNRQWLYIVIEVVICVATAGWIRHRRNAPDRG